MQGEILVQPSLAVLRANVERLTIGLGIRIVTCPEMLLIDMGGDM